MSISFRLRNRGLLFSMAFLAFVAAAALGLAWPLAAHFGGAASPERAALAAALCLAGAECAIIVTWRLRDPEKALLALLVGTTLRMGIPIIFALFLHFIKKPLANAEFLYYLGAFYAITLTASAYLSLPREA